MKHSQHLKETAEDIAVKDRLWSATERELLYFAGRMREEHKPGHDGDTDGQRDVVSAARDRGYPVTLIRFLSAAKRADVMDEAGSERIALYRDKLGLGVSEANRART
ncbi:hypothetical protein [Mameliella alba]|uniref:Uncharacterized protein n=1 Tax=Mameliella alba TaxID=561184 RepID=A0A0B3RWK4_9RHOB|nr:hypothetical protein [Mameliella alba]KHQ51128.1 hypothetical protein OA50_04499 [Mameliella alba]